MNPVGNPSATFAQRSITPTERMAGLPPAALDGLGKVDRLIKANQLDLADHALRGVINVAPTHAEVLRVRGLVAHMRGDRAQAIRLLQQAMDRQPNDAMILNHLGGLLREAGQIEEGLRLMRLACELAPNLPSAWINLGTSLQAEGRPEEGIAALDRALQLEPRNLPTRIAHANGLRALGRIDDAATEYRHAISIQPDYAPAWFSLLDMKTIALGTAELAALEKLVGKADLSSQYRAFAGFALGLALENAGRYPEAFKAFVDANTIWRASFQWDLDAFSTLMDQFMSAFEQPLPVAADPMLGNEVIFIVSLPRSGSTLAEQILGAHTDIDGAGELPDMPATIQEESARLREPFPQWVGKATAADWERLGHRYLERTRKWRGDATKYTDKSLANWPFLGAIATMLPGARFINCRRDPLETSWSCYKQLFARSPHPFAYTLDELGGYWREYDRLMCFWHARYPGRVYDQVYEDLLADPERQIRRMLAFCDVAFDPACLEFHTSKRSVGTASSAQVREPLRGDTARADFYGELLDPLRRSLGLT
jgi:tetratricopeptide (TPR) repeat protein